MREHFKHLPPHEENNREADKQDKAFHPHQSQWRCQMGLSLGSSHFLGVPGSQVTCTMGRTAPGLLIHCSVREPHRPQGWRTQFTFLEGTCLLTIRQLLINRYLEISGQDSRCYRPTQGSERGLWWGPQGSLEPKVLHPKPQILFLSCGHDAESAFCCLETGLRSPLISAAHDFIQRSC